MDGDLPEGGTDRTLNRMVAITVVILSVFMGISKVKDDNIVQAMQQAKADAVDHWSEYQAVRTKLHVAETARAEIGLIAQGAGMASQAAPILARLDADIVKYQAKAPAVQGEAKADEAKYDALNVHDDQFDMSDALLAIALSLAAVAALTDLRWLLYTAWVPAAFGLLMGIAGFLGWSIHPDAIANLLS